MGATFYRRLAALIFGMAGALGAQVEFFPGDGRIDIRLDGKEFSSFYFGPDVPKPFLHPLRAADGTIVTRGFPMEEVPGESRDHAHHRGVWFTHGDVNGCDFWANEFDSGRPNQGVISLRSIRHASNESKRRGAIEAVFEWRSTEGELLLVEDRVMTFHAGSTNRVIDFDFTVAAAEREVRFGDTKEGAFAIRVATEIEEDHLGAAGIPRTGRIRSATGKTGEIEVWGRRAQWVDYSGSIRGKKLGIAIFDHPSNPRHPTYWHVRSYGLFAANIFGERDFHADPKRDAGLTLDSGAALRFQYRVVVHPGDTETADVKGLYRRYVEKDVTTPVVRR